MDPERILSQWTQMKGPQKGKPFLLLPEFNTCHPLRIADVPSALERTGMDPMNGDSIFLIGADQYSRPPNNYGSPIVIPFTWDLSPGFNSLEVETGPKNGVRLRRSHSK